MPQFSAPASTSGIDLDAAKGHLLMVTPLGQEKDVKTVHGLADPIRANVVDLDAEVEYEDVLIFPRVLISQLKPKIGEIVLGVLGQGEAKAGQSKPWVIAKDHTADDEKRANAWIAKQSKPQFASAASTDDAPF